MAAIGAPRLCRYFGRKRRQRFSPRFMSSIAVETAMISGVRPKNARARARRESRLVVTPATDADFDGSASLAVRAGECRMETAGQLGRVVVRPEMHEEESRRLLQHVAVDGRHLDAILAQGAEHRIHFAPDEDEVTSDGGLAPAGRLEIDRRCFPAGERLERDPTAEREGRCQLNVPKHYLEIAARK